MSSKLPDDVWEGARIIWESTQKITDRELLAQLQEIYGDKAPKSHTAIGRRRKNWAKNNFGDGDIGAPKTHQAKKPRTKNAPRNKNNAPKMHQNNKEHLDAPNKDDAPKMNQNTGLVVWAKTEQRIHAAAEKLILDKQEKAKIILKQRRRIKKLGELQDTILDTINNSLRGFDQDEDGEKIAKPDSSMASTMRAARVLSTLTTSQKSLYEQEMTVCGIKKDDFEISDQERRMQSLKLLDGIDEEERRARDEKLPELMERLRLFESMSVDDLDKPEGSGDGYAEEAGDYDIYDSDDDEGDE